MAIKSNKSIPSPLIRTLGYWLITQQLLVFVKENSFSFLMKELLEHFPPLNFACAYGSAAVTQYSYDATSSLLDLIFVVGDAKEWHLSNRRLNPTHYACPHSVTLTLQPLGAGVYYNTDVVVRGRRIKYGVIQEDIFLSDLWEWRTLYLAGRLHKPIVPFTDQSSAIREAMIVNQRHAANTALFLLPRRFTTQEYLETIVGISFLGDFRMGLAEDPQKVRRIVRGQEDALWNMYSSFCKDTGVASLVGDQYEQNYSPMELISRLSSLPLNLIQRPRQDLFYLAKQPESISHILKSSIASIVRQPALTQAVKGIVTAGISKSLSYALTKLGKRFL
jgi:translocator assembly and maintenance protein 41